MDKQKTGIEQLSGYRRIADIGFGCLALLLALLGFVQIFLAGVGAFGHDFGMHAVLGNILGLASLLILLLALVAHRSRFMIGAAVVLVLLADVAQHGLASVGWGNEWLGGLHAISGIIAVALAGNIGGRTLGGYKKKA